MSTMINPFKPATKVLDDRFIGREKELYFLRELVRAEVGGISIVGQPRIGKTSIAQKIFRELDGMEKSGIWIDLGTQDHASFFREFYQGLLRIVSEKTRNILRDFRKSEEPYACGEPPEKFEFRFIRSALEIVKQEQPLFIVVFIDEFDGVRNFNNPGSFCQEIRSFIENTEFNMTFILISRRDLAALETAVGSFLSGVCGNRLFVIPFSREESETMMKRIESKYPLTDDLRKELIDFSGGHPYLLEQALSDVWFNSTLSNTARNSLMQYFERLRDLLQEDHLWKTLTQSVLWGIHPKAEAECYTRLISYGLILPDPSENRSWSSSFDMFVEKQARESPIYEVWAEIENKLREFVNGVCCRSLGDDWINSHRNQKTIASIFFHPEKGCLYRLERNKKTLGINIGLLDAAYPADLWQIIELFWEHFKPIMHESFDDWKKKFAFLISLRTPIGHSNTKYLLDEQCMHFHEITTDLDRVMTNWKNSLT